VGFTHRKPEKHIEAESAKASIPAPQEPKTAPKPVDPNAIRVAELVSLEGRPRSIPGTGVRLTVGLNVISMRVDPLGIEIGIKGEDPIVIPLSRFAWLRR
jgi:hypothetical protein